jgi:hypothetical protein
MHLYTKKPGIGFKAFAGFGEKIKAFQDPFSINALAICRKAAGCSACIQ